MKKAIGAAIMLTAVVALFSVGQIAAQEKPRKVDEYGAIKPEDEEQSLDSYAIELDNDPQSKAYIITYGGRKSSPGAAKTASKRVFDFLVTKRAFDPSRVIRIDGGLREEPFTELWVVPRGARPPAATATIRPAPKTPVKKTTKKGT